MSDVRVCGKRCHDALNPSCVCWCGGLFHGKGGAEAREAFAEIWGDIPKTEPEPEPAGLFDGSAGPADRWRAALSAARHASARGSPPRQ